MYKLKRGREKSIYKIAKQFLRHGVTNTHKIYLYIKEKKITPNLRHFWFQNYELGVRTLEPKACRVGEGRGGDSERERGGRVERGEGFEGLSKVRRIFTGKEGGLRTA
ncbi:UNVERIFIED_CONTAM: hypothetical protein K2H54_042202 [Gekko kuhli]